MKLITISFIIILVISITVIKVKNSRDAKKFNNMTSEFDEDNKE